MLFTPSHSHSLLTVEERKKKTLAATSIIQSAMLIFFFSLSLSLHGHEPHLTDQTRSGCRSRAALTRRSPSHFDGLMLKRDKAPGFLLFCFALLYVAARRRDRPLLGFFVVFFVFDKQLCKLTSLSFSLLLRIAQNGRPPQKIQKNSLKQIMYIHSQIHHQCSYWLLPLVQPITVYLLFAWAGQEMWYPPQPLPAPTTHTRAITHTHTHFPTTLPFHGETSFARLRSATQDLWAILSSAASLLSCSSELARHRNRANGFKWNMWGLFLTRTAETAREGGIKLKSYMKHLMEIETCHTWS